MSIAAVDWQTVSALATALGTLVLAVATFVAVRSANRSARISEQALLTGLRPLLLHSMADDPPHKALWSDRHTARVAGGRAVVELVDAVIYLAVGLRNVGAGIALLHGWDPRSQVFGDPTHRPAEEFRRLTIDLYVPPGGTGYWESAIRDADDPMRAFFETKVLGEREPFAVDLLYGDQEGGQRRISRFVVLPASSEDGGWYVQAARHWSVDGPDPRGSA